MVWEEPEQHKAERTQRSRRSRPTGEWTRAGFLEEGHWCYLKGWKNLEKEKWREDTQAEGTLGSKMRIGEWRRGTLKWVVFWRILGEICGKLIKAAEKNSGHWRASKGVWAKDWVVIYTPWLTGQSSKMKESPKEHQKLGCSNLGSKELRSVKCHL